ncbi:porin family protein [Bacillus sp. NP157]|nr:porin family protein [Bacillus sp. NP157]
MRIRPTRFSKAASGLALASLALFGAAAHAQDSTKKSQSPALDNISLWVGGYYTNNDTTIGAKTPTLNSSGDVNLEDDLNFKKHKTVPRVRLDFLIGEHQGFAFDWYEVNRSQSKTLSDQINFLGQPIDATARVKGDLKFSFGSAAYKWWFGTGDDVFGVGLGAAYYKVHASIYGSATINGDTEQQGASTNLDAWAPNLQLGWRHAFNDQWRMYINASGVKKNGGPLNGHIYDTAIGLEWFPWQNVGFGAEYAYTRIKLNQDKSRYDLDLDMKLNGPAAYVRFRF